MHFQEEWISSVVVALLIKAIAHQLACVHVNHGLFHKGEPEKDIKAYHNAGGFSEDMNHELVEPLWILFKDEVCIVGEELVLLNGISSAIHRTKSRKWTIHPLFMIMLKKVFKFTIE